MENEPEQTVTDQLTIEFDCIKEVIEVIEIPDNIVLGEE